MNSELSDKSMEYTPEEKAECIRKMEAVSDLFYQGAIHTGCHAFIEFNGLMNEFIKICQDNKDMNFMQANTHTGQRMKVAGYRIKYLKEKLNCIFSGITEDATKAMAEEIDASTGHSNVRKKMSKRKQAAFNKVRDFAADVKKAAGKYVAVDDALDEVSMNSHPKHVINKAS